MIRVLPLACIAVVLAAASAHAGPKPSIAVLGIEVADTNGIAAADTTVAKELTEGLRSRAKVGSGPYSLAPGSDRELIDEKLIKNCDNEAPACMASIGNDIGAEMLMFGKISKEGKSYRVDLKLLNVTKKQMEKTWSEQIPLAQATGQGLQRWAMTGYAKLTGETSSGQLVIIAKNIDRGTVLIDNEERGNIVAGRAQISGLPEGHYKLRIEAQGFQPYDTDITITAGQSTSVPAEPVPMSTTITPPPPHCPGAPDCDDGSHMGGGTVPRTGGNGWKKAFIGGAIATAAFGATWAYGYSQLHPTGRWNSSDPNDPGGFLPQYGSKCTEANIAADPTGLGKSCSAGGRNQAVSYVGTIGTGVAAGFTIVAFVEAFVINKDSQTSTEHAQGHRKHKDQFVVTPVILPGGGGATIKLDF